MRHDPAWEDDVFPPDDAPLPDPTRAERATVYRWLSGIFAREPSPDALRAYAGTAGDALLTALAEIHEVAPVAEMIQVWLPDASARDLKVISHDLAGEFAHLFLGVGGRRGAPPYQSAYAGSKARLMREQAGAMNDALRRCDARVAESFPEPSDHVSVQLALMADLAETADAEEQLGFLRRGLLDWTTEFRDRCAAVSRHGFYTCAASALVDFIAVDAARLRDAITEAEPAGNTVAERAAPGPVEPDRREASLLSTRESADNRERSSHSTCEEQS